MANRYYSLSEKIQLKYFLYDSYFYLPSFENATLYSELLKDILPRVVKPKEIPGEHHFQQR